MSARERWARALSDAAGEGLLGGDPLVPPEERPWPVVLLTAFGAWLAAIPLCGFFGLLLGGLIEAGAGYPIGVACLVAAVVVLRARGLPLFVEQLAVPGLLVGGGLLAFGLYDDMPDERQASAVLAAVAIGLAVAVPRAWLRAWLGSVAAGMVAMALLPPDVWFRAREGGNFWWAVHGLLVVWLVALAVQRAIGSKVALAVEPLAAGWVLVVVAGLAFLSGMTFLVGGATGQRFWGDGWQGEALLERGVSVGLAMAGFVGLARVWPSARRPVWALAALVCVALAGAMSTLGGLMLVLAVCAGTGRWRLASAAAVGVAWVIGAYYYRLDVALADKALVLVAAGALLGAIAWWSGPRRTPAGSVPPAPRFELPPALVPIAVVLCLLVVNTGIWQKEAVIANGRTVLVELAPVDPRSLAQGDYMALNFRLPAVAAEPRPSDLPPHVVVQVDERGVALPLRIELAGEEAPVLAPGELRIEMTAKDGRWVLVTDAWFFKEGDAERFAEARYGEFRITADGDAVLVGLRDTRLVPIPP